MNTITIDPAKCKRDAFCVSVCPMKIIHLKDEKDVPHFIPGGEQMCIRCGHCVAVCPYAALSHSAMKPEDCPPLKKELVPTAEHMEHIIRSRRSTRAYQGKAVGKDKLSQLINMARYAPTGTNSQRLGWIVVTEREEVKRLTKMAVEWMRGMVKSNHPLAGAYRMADIIKAYELGGIDLICRDAPALVLVHAPKTYPAGALDSAIALAYMDLAAQSLGLGACWAGFFMMAAMQSGEIQKALRLPEGEAFNAAMMVGYPRLNYKRLPLRNEPRITWHTA